ncbi:hypothetical protein TGRUB_236060 [Toxoplasma gondii RUB]|uniref:Uncharacterized protein n=4 Tax=Toxoplasma gondii TaxID=5811 RepID=A0A086M0M8_TOXGO|nr:hypothetical protein TGFOU_236060 [Toxoplasma gondii FOU]KFG62446.1 hypothetical protein TGRUB_236060 [Toxoplasma gondii RUB]PUA84839.1 hypothetical protein TGBR9_236060 [Toxoplasma gondii TgCATBr9]RQX70155.1 hypothetical protein TGCAST_236060 [Toxoplasma gondii CAST]
MNILPLHFSEGLREATHSSGILEVAREAGKVVQPVARYLSNANSCGVPLELNRLQNKGGLLDCFHQTLGVKLHSNASQHGTRQRTPGAKSRTTNAGLVRASLSSVSLKQTAEGNRSRSSTTASSDSARQSDSSSPPPTNRTARRCRSVSRPPVKGGSPARAPQRKPAALWNALSRELVTGFSVSDAAKPRGMPPRVLSRPTLRSHSRVADENLSATVSAAPRRRLGNAETAAKKPEEGSGTGPGVDRMFPRVARSRAGGYAVAAVSSTASSGEISQNWGRAAPGVARSVGSRRSSTFGSCATPEGRRQEVFLSAGRDSKRRAETPAHRTCSLKPSDRRTVVARPKESTQNAQHEKWTPASGALRSTLFPQSASATRHTQRQLRSTSQAGFLGGAVTPKRGPMSRSSADGVASSNTKEAARCGARSTLQRATQSPAVPTRKPQANGSAMPFSLVSRQSGRLPVAASATEGPGRSRERGGSSFRRSGSKMPPNVPKLDLRKCMQFRTRD